MVDLLLDKGYKVVVFDDRSTGNNENPKAINIIGDISKKEDLELITHHVHVFTFVILVLSESFKSIYNKIRLITLYILLLLFSSRECPKSSQIHEDQCRWIFKHAAGEDLVFILNKPNAFESGQQIIK
jgi:hypothetical protein